MGQNIPTIDCVIISHFHLDHCGALPYFTERIGYHGPVFMTHPTRAIAPILLEDMRKIMADKKDEPGPFSSTDIETCMAKVIPLSLHETFDVDGSIFIKPYYAGHVIGAAMFHIRIGDQSIVYTGDYNMTPDRHLGAAWIDKCQPDLLITETTYATTVRDSRRARERDFLQKVHQCVSRGGKVLIPVFALGRAQELCILIESYWERMNLKVPVFFSAGLTTKANEYYKLFINWTNQKIKSEFLERNMFDFKHIEPFDLSLVNDPRPMVLFASPGMLHAGTSLEVFRHWCHDERNMVILPGYCVAGTVGAKVLAGEKNIQVDLWTKVKVKMAVENLSFSAHADAKGILQLIQMCEPKNVMLVHGEKAKMAVLKTKIMHDLRIPCFDPANFSTTTIRSQTDSSAVKLTRALLREVYMIEHRKHLKLMEGTDKDSYPKFTAVTMDTVRAYLEEQRTGPECNTPPSTAVKNKKQVLEKMINDAPFLLKGDDLIISVEALLSKKIESLFTHRLHIPAVQLQKKPDGFQVRSIYVKIIKEEKKTMLRATWTDPVDGFMVKKLFLLIEL
jgi:integrator complex subunit 11